MPRDFKTWMGRNAATNLTGVGESLERLNTRAAVSGHRATGRKLPAVGNVGTGFFEVWTQYEFASGVVSWYPISAFNATLSGADVSLAPDAPTGLWMVTFRLRWAVYIPSELGYAHCRDASGRQVGMTVSPGRDEYQTTGILSAGPSSGIGIGAVSSEMIPSDPDFGCVFTVSGFPLNTTGEDPGEGGSA